MKRKFQGTGGGERMWSRIQEAEGPFLEGLKIIFKGNYAMEVSIMGHKDTISYKFHSLNSLSVYVTVLLF